MERFVPLNIVKNLLQIWLIAAICVLGWACGGNNQTSENMKVELVNKKTELANKKPEPVQTELDTSEVDADNTNEVYWQKIFAKRKAAPRIVEGTISGYICGHACYLTITDKKGKSHSGGCSAPICDKWEQKAGMPKSYIGKRVRVSISKTLITDVEGYGPKDAQDEFIKIRFLK
ncbi:hypothetical protein BH10ACI1_BH10ACI1_25560 [soil metagenome]